MTYTLTGRLTDMLLTSPEALEALRGSAVPSQPVINDFDEGVVRVGRVPLTFDQDGNFSVPLVGTDTGSVAAWHLVIDYRDAAAKSKVETFTSGWFEMTEDTNFLDVNIIVLAPVDTTVLESVYEARDDALAAAQEATDNANGFDVGTVTTGTPGSSATASITGTAPNRHLNLQIPAGANGGSDASTAANVTSGPLTGTALSTGYAGSAVRGRLSPLARIGKAGTGPFRVYAIGTSIANFDSSVLKCFISAMQQVYGISQWTQWQAGVAGGDYSSDYQGWKKQNYGGLAFTRLRGSSSSSPITLTFYGDTMRVEFSRETDSAAASITVDGATTGLSSSTSTASGSQVYRQAVTWTGTKGIHTLVITPPAGAGYAYLEAVDYGVAARTGVEYIDATLGGSALKWLTTLPATTLPTPVVPISGTSALDYHFNRTDVDLYLVEHAMNEGDEAGFYAGVDYVVAKTALIGVPVVLVVEAFNDYATNVNRQKQRQYLLAQGAAHGHVTVIDWHTMLACDGNVTAMNTLYYGGSSGPNYPHPTTGQATAIVALSEVAGLRTPETDGAAAFAAARMARAALRKSLTQKERLTTKTATISGASIAVSNPVARAVQLVTVGADCASSELVYQAAVARNYVDLTTSIATAGTSDTWGGAYIATPSTPTIGLSINAADVNAPMKLVITGIGDAGSLLNFVLPTGLRLYDDQGNVVPYNNAGSTTRVVVNAGIGGTEAPTTYSLNVRATSTSPGNFGFSNGRIYAATLAASDTAVLAAPVVSAPSAFVTTVEPVTVQQSRLFNGNFGLGTLDGWAVTTGGVIQQNANASVGKYQVHFPSGGGTLTSDILPVFGGDVIPVEVIAKPDSGTFTLTVTAVFTDHTGAAVSTGTVFTAPGSYADGSGGVLFANIHSGAITVPGTARFASIKVTGDAAFGIQRVRIPDGGEPWIIAQTGAASAAASPLQDTTGITLPFPGIWDIALSTYTNGNNNLAMATFRVFFKDGSSILATDQIGTSHTQTSGDQPVITLTTPTIAGLIKATTTWVGGASRAPVWRYRARLVSPYL